MTHRLSYPSPAMVVALFALFTSLAGGAYAAVNLPARQCRNHSDQERSRERDQAREQCGHIREGQGRLAPSLRTSRRASYKRGHVDPKACRARKGCKVYRARKGHRDRKAHRGSRDWQLPRP